ncbi:MAG: SigB/SigF/SigG family RNA polymerase sigma factor [Acidimicrobiales bacterium]|nr:SigB/SigF/SigG family RNA polymerase sigma factor [Acidimicrobiales bacterium]
MSDLTPEEALDLFREYKQHRRRAVRNRLVEEHMGFAHHIAHRYRNRGVADDDLHQVALVGLVKAVDRFDPEFGVAFTTFAGRTIEGEVKRHFRDATWAVRVPRSMKNTSLQVRGARDELGQTLGRPPTVPEVAAHLGIDTDEVVAALAASEAFGTDSLLTGSDRGDATRDRDDVLGTVDEELESTVDRALVESLLELLSDRDRRIVELRFYEQLSQQEIADRVGVSQMHVSRLLSRSLTLMRAEATSGD